MQNVFVGHTSAPSPLEKRFAAYTDGLAKAAGHADRSAPLKAYCAGMLLPGERSKSVEPMAARLAPDNVRRTHQSLHHLVAEAPWSDEAVVGSVRERVLTAMQQNGPVAAWIVDDSGLLISAECRVSSRNPVAVWPHSAARPPTA
jgi:SRSO17 transposase